MLHFRKLPKKNGEIWRKFSNIWPNLGEFAKFWKKTAKNSAIFNEHFEIRERSALCRSRRELSNEYLLAKIGFDTAENELI